MSRQMVRGFVFSSALLGMIFLIAPDGLAQGQDRRPQERPQANRPNHSAQRPQQSRPQQSRPQQSRPAASRPSRPQQPHPQPSRPNRPGGHPVARPPARPNPSRPSGPRPNYQFRPQDRSRLQSHYRRLFAGINRARRPRFAAGGYFPQYELQYFTPVPASLLGYLPPVPPGYACGYYQGYVVVYDPATYFILNLVDLLTQ